MPTGNATLTDIAAGADGNIWFFERHGHKIGKVIPQGPAPSKIPPDRIDWMGSREPHLRHLVSETAHLW